MPTLSIGASCKAKQASIADTTRIGAVLANSVWVAGSFVEALDTRAIGTSASYTTAAIADTDSNAVLAGRD